MTRTVACAVLGLALAGPAMAQNQSSQSQANPGASGQTQAQQGQSGAIRQQIMRNLQEAGFTDIKVMPESFLVRAKDKNGNPIMMVMNPDSVTAVEVQGGRNSTTGSANRTPGAQTNPSGTQTSPSGTTGK